MLFVRPTKITDAMFISSNVTENDDDDAPLWSETTAYTTAGQLVRRSTSHRVYEAAKVSSVKTVTITLATPGVVSWESHGFEADTPLVLTTTGALPTGYAAGVTYYVKSPTANGFSLAAAPGGAAIATSGSQSGTHMATVQSNFNKVPEDNVEGDTPFWIEVKPTNKWAVFDEAASVSTEAEDAIEIEIAPGGANSLLLVGLDAISVDIELKDGATTVATRTEDLILENVFDWFQYFTEPIIRKDKVRINDLPVYANGHIFISINYPGGVAKCSEIVVGMSRYIGELLWEPQIKLIDHSRKRTDPYGNTRWKKRGFAFLLRCQLKVPNELVDEVVRVLAEYRSTPGGWIGEGDFRSATQFGAYRDFELVIRGPDGSDCNLEIEGLTQ